VADELFALSLKQPWAALLAAGRKSIEVRTWATARRGRVLIHAAAVPDDREEAWKWVTDDIRPLTRFAGGVLGEGELVEVRDYSTEARFAADVELHLNDLSWFAPKLCGFVFRDTKVRPFRKLPGNVKFFRVDASEIE